MALIDDLISRVDDPSLRKSIEAQVAQLQKGREFGLVFEHHEAESVELPTYRARKGSVVRIKRYLTKGKKAVRDERLWKVAAITKDPLGVRIATLQPYKQAVPAAEPLEDDGPVTEPVSELVTVAEVGTPVYPGLRHTGTAVHPDATPDASKPAHLVIKGENYHALQALTFTHAESVDVIYIDPPYNTGGDFTYNDKRVAREDSFRHSKWLSFMDRRLRLAHRLLKDTGVIIVAIDDNEQAHLRLLMDQVFGEENFISTTVWKSKTGGGSGSDYINEHEYALIFSKSSRRIVFRDPEGLTDANYPLEDPDGRRYGLVRLDQASLGYVPTLDFPIYGPDGTRYEPRQKDPQDPNARWRWGAKKVESQYADLVFKNGNVYTKNFKNSVGSIPRSVLSDTRFGRSLTGSKAVDRVLGGKRFQFPKPLPLLTHLLTVLSDPDAVVLDFFGGSGSTLHAVLEMNAADNGNRQCILVTNNEVEVKQAATLVSAGVHPGDPEWESGGVAERVTRPRISTVVTGIREHLDGSTYSAGLPSERVEFFDLTHEDPGAVRLSQAYDSIEPLLWLNAGAKGPFIPTPAGTTGFTISGSYAVLHSASDAHQFVRQVTATQGTDSPVTHTYVVTDSAAEFQSVVAALPTDLRDNAMRLYEKYTRTFETNK